MKIVKELISAANRLQATAPVDDDFPEMMHVFDAKLRAASEWEENIPKIVCLCGSTKFVREYAYHNEQFTLEGYIVLSVGSFSGKEIGGAVKEDLDILHKRKIDLCDFIYVINPGGYIGESTRSEIVYATAIGVQVRYAEDTARGKE